MAEVDFTFDLEDELTEEQRRLMNIRAAKAVGIAPNLGPPPPMTIDGIPAREFTTRENMAQQQGKTFQQTDEGVGFQGRELIGPAAVAAALSANKAAPANAAAGFTPPPDIAPPPNLNPLAGVSLPDQRMQDIRGQMAGIREAMANEIPVTASQDEVDQLAAAGQPVPTGVPSPAFDDPVGATADPLAALEMAQAFAQPQIDMPPPGLPGFDPQTDPLNIMPNLPEDLDAAVASAGLPPQSEYGQPIPGYFDAGESNFSARLNELEARLAAEEDLEGAAGLGQNVNRGASRIGRGGQGLGQDIAEGAVNLAGNVWDPVSDFFSGLSRGQNFQSTANAAGDDTTGTEDVITEGETNTADEAGERENNPRQKPGFLDAPPETGVDGVDERSVTAGDQGGPGVDVVSDIRGGSRGIATPVADSLLGERLRSKDQRGPGVEVIRGMRQTFQPILDGPLTKDEYGNMIGGGADGSEIPFGQGTIERFHNMGFSLDEAGDLAIEVAGIENEFIEAGAQQLIAKTNAVLDDNVRTINTEGVEVRSILSIDPTQPGGLRLTETDQSYALNAELEVAFTKKDFTNALGEETSETTPVFHEKLMSPSGRLIMRQVPVDMSDVQLMNAVSDPNWRAAIAEATTMGLKGEARILEAVKIVEDSNARSEQ